jgi:endonuclease G
MLLLSCTKQTSSVTTPPGTPDTVVLNPHLPGYYDTISMTDNNNMLPGNATMAMPDSTMENNYLLNQTWYIACYSRARGIPTWTSWHLESADIGSAGRQDNFRPYTWLPGGWYRAGAGSYKGSVTGFDRGHNCPSGDRTSSTAANGSTFYMTNMIPQASQLNQGPWEGLEDYIRNTLVGTTGEAYIIMGSYGAGGLGAGHTDTAYTLDSGRITVPAKVWKVVLLLPKGSNDLNRINASTTVLAVNMPNINNLYTTTAAGKNAWQNYITTVDALETEAGAYGVSLHLLSNIPPAIRAVLKSKQFKP